MDRAPAPPAVEIDRVDEALDVAEAIEPSV